MKFTAPDWRNAKAYPVPAAQTDTAFWAWQFLRRNHGYQVEWANYVASLESMFERTPSLREEFDACGLVSSRVDRASEHIELWSCVPPAQPDELSLGQYLKRGMANISSCRRKDVALGEKWGIQRLQSPAWENLVRRNGFLKSGSQAKFIVHDRSNVDDPNYLLQEFDLRLPVAALEAQFTAFLKVRSHFIEIGQVVPYKGRLAEANYANYLRVLDAFDDGATAVEIARVLLSHQDESGAKNSVENWRKAAIKLRDDNYRALAWSVLKDGTKRKLKG